MLNDDRRFCEMTNGGLWRILGVIETKPLQIRANELRIAKAMTELIRRDAARAHASHLGRDPETGKFTWSIWTKPVTAISTHFNAGIEWLKGNVQIRNEHIKLKEHQQHQMDIIRVDFADCGYNPDPKVLEETSLAAYSFHKRMLVTNPDYLYAWVTIENYEFMRRICYLKRMIRELDAKGTRTPEEKLLKGSYEHRLRLCQSAARMNAAKAEPIIMKLRYRDAILAYDYYQALALLDVMRDRGYLPHLVKVPKFKIDEKKFEELSWDDKMFEEFDKQTEEYAKYVVDDSKFQELKQQINWEITKGMGRNVLENWGNMGVYAAGFGYVFGKVGLVAGGGGPTSLLEYLYGVVNPFSGALTGWKGFRNVVENILEEAAEEAIGEAARKAGVKDQNYTDFIGMCTVETASAIWGSFSARAQEQQVKFNNEPAVKLRSMTQLGEDAVASITGHPFYTAVELFLGLYKEVGLLANVEQLTPEQVEKVRQLDESVSKILDYVNVWAYVKRKWGALRSIAETEMTGKQSEKLWASFEHWSMKLASMFSSEFEYERRLSRYVQGEVEKFKAEVEKQGGTSVELASSLLRKFSLKELRKIKGMELDGEPLLPEDVEKVIVDQVRYLVQATMEATAGKFPGKLVAFYIDGSSADPEGKEFQGTASDNDLTALVAAVAASGEVKGFFDNYFRQHAGMDPSEWEIECFQDPFDRMDTSAEDWDMKAVEKYITDVGKGITQAERYINVGTLRFLKLVGKLRAKIFIMQDGRLVAIGRDHPYFERLYGNLKLETGDGLDIVLDQEHFVRKYEGKYADDLRGLVHALAKYNIREMVGAMAAKKEGARLLNELTAAVAKEEGGPHYAFVKAAEESGLFTNAQISLAKRWLKLKSGMPVDKAFQQMLALRLNKKEKAFNEAQKKLGKRIRSGWPKSLKPSRT